MARSSPAANLARPALTSFVGRRRELAEARRRMAESRLVTVTGPGGVGKTRLALELAERVGKAFRDGVWVVELATVEEGAAIASAVAAALAVADQSARPAGDKLLDHLHDRQLLLVLDNCEHLLAPVARLVADLLAAAPGLRVLATSREPLGLVGEQVYTLPPLTTPDPARKHPPAGIVQFEAVQLLIDRARANVPDFAVTAENVEAVVQLCTRLDGIPLAIELAATRLRTLSVSQVRDRLDRRFQLLTGGDRAALPRQQTLRALIDWSYELCSEPERLLWSRLAAFPGGFDLDAAEAVCGFGDLDREDVVDVLDRLVAKSLVVTERSGETVRYGQLMTIRQYAAERLAGTGELPQLKRRQRDHYRGRAVAMVELWCGPGQADALRAMHRDHANLISVLEWSASTRGEERAGAELAALLRYHWIAGGHLADGRHWLQQLLARLGTPSPERGTALWVAAWVALI
jgi:predicted ATPase